MADLEPEQKAVIIDRSPPWSRTTKTIVVLLGMLLLALVAWRFKGLIKQVVLAAMLAYVLNPVIRFIDERTPLKRPLLILLIYFVLIILVFGAFTALGVAAYGQMLNLIQELPSLVNDLVIIVRNLTQQPDIAIGPFQLSPETLDWPSIQDQLLGLTEPALSRTGRYARQLAGTTLRTLGNLLFVWVISIYLALEIPRMREYVGKAAQQPGYRRDAERLMAEFGQIWSAYLRGQIILGVIIGLVVGLGLGALGVQNALALGILSGLLEFVPVVGPLIGTGAAVIVAFFQPSNYLGLSNVDFALLILAVMFVIQQLENNILVPRIVGDALDLHALLVIVGVFMGATLAGIVGAILAAPLLATVKLLGIYAWRKLFDLPPFPEEELRIDPSRRPSLLMRTKQFWQRRQLEEDNPESKQTDENRPQ